MGFTKDYIIEIEQKGMTFDHDVSYSFTLFSSLLIKRGKKIKIYKITNAG